MKDNMISILKPNKNNENVFDKISTTIPNFLNQHIDEFISESSLSESSSVSNIDIDFYDGNNFLINGTDISSNSTNLTNIESPSKETDNDWVNLTAVIIKGIIFSSIIVAAVLGNALVIISVQRNRKLR